MKKVFSLIMILLICLFISCSNNTINKSRDDELIYLSNKYICSSFDFDIIAPYIKISDNLKEEDFYYSSYDKNLNIIKSVDRNGKIKFYFKEGYDKSLYEDLLIEKIVLYTTEIHSGISQQSISYGININKEDRLLVNNLVDFVNTVHFDFHSANPPMYNFRLFFYDYDYIYYDQDYYLLIYIDEIYVLKDTLNNRAYKINYDYESLIKEGIYAINKLI